MTHSSYTARRVGQVLGLGAGLVRRYQCNVLSMRRELPSTSPDILAYDPGQTERWFDSKERCEKYLGKAIKLVGADGRLAVRVGFHASDDPFDLY